MVSIIRSIRFFFDILTIFYEPEPVLTAFLLLNPSADKNFRNIII